jgi:hypothetical protein
LNAGAQPTGQVDPGAGIVNPDRVEEEGSYRYIVLGVIAAGEARSRSALTLGARAARIATLPAARVWRSPVAAPVRRRAEGVASSLDRDGRQFAGRADARSVALANAAAGVVDRVFAAGIADAIVDRLLATGALDRMITVVINHPATDELVTNALDEPGLERLITRVMDSRMLDELVTRLLYSHEFQQVLERVTRSPELRSALAHQTAGMAGDVADGMRSRTVGADLAVERFARSIARRGRRRQPKDE